MVDLKTKFPDGFFDEEVRDGFTVTKRMKELWAVEIDLLLELTRVCEKNGIKFFVSDGTLLGAVRHGGFIPWDDDIDVVMMRGEYEKLKEVASDEFRHPYFFQANETDVEYVETPKLRNLDTTCYQGYVNYRPFRNGIFIDILVLDRIPDGKFSRRMFNFGRLLRGFSVHLSAMLIDRIESKVLKRKMRTPVYSRTCRKRFGKFDRYLCKYSGADTRDVATWQWYFPKHEKIYRRSWFDKTHKAKFEFFEVDVIDECDSYLRMKYGDDYMTPRMGAAVHSGLIFDAGRPNAVLCDKSGKS